MTGAPNCNNPPWSDFPAEQETIRESWDPQQAILEYRLLFPESKRTDKAIVCEWYRAHEKIAEAEAC